MGGGTRWIRRQVIINKLWAYSSTGGQQEERGVVHSLITSQRTQSHLFFLLSVGVLFTLVNHNTEKEQPTIIHPPSRQWQPPLESGRPGVCIGKWAKRSAKGVPYQKAVYDLHVDEWANKKAINTTPHPPPPRNNGTGLPPSWD